MSSMRTPNDYDTDLITDPPNGRARSRRVKITLPEPLAEQLEDLAETAGEPVATVAAQIVRQHLEMASNGSRTPNAGVSAAAAMGRTSGGRPPWLPPYGGDREWSELMWGSILALHGRYPTVLGHLKDGWWNDAAHVETLCALAVWRDWLDDSGRDPRQELAFQYQLYDFGRSLRHEGGGVTKAWRPGVQPAEWGT
jgi:hypothetical protein